MALVDIWSRNGRRRSDQLRTSSDRRGRRSAPWVGARAVRACHTYITLFVLLGARAVRACHTSMKSVLQ